MSTDPSPKAEAEFAKMVSDNEAEKKLRRELMQLEKQQLELTIANLERDPRMSLIGHALGGLLANPQFDLTKPADVPAYLAEPILRAADAILAAMARDKETSNG